MLAWASLCIVAASVAPSAAAQERAPRLVLSSSASVVLYARPAPAPLAEAHPFRFVATDSLPAGMPLGTRILWGEGGLMRTVGLAPSTRRAELRTRRRMLQWHQGLGLATFAAMTAQVISGERIANDPGRYYERYQPIHRTLGYATFGAYSATATLSIFAPPGRRYSEGFSTIKLHRWLAVVHFAGMMAQPFLGVKTARASSLDEYTDAVRTHRWTGRVTYGAYTLALVSTLLPF
jgi:hypothetical protein